MSELITYRGGSCGDFIRLLLSNANCVINDKGKITHKEFDDYTRTVRQLIELKDSIDSIIEKTIKLKNKARLRTDFLTSHDYHVFVERFGNSLEFFRFINELGIKRVLYISITTEKSNKLRTYNSLIKNQDKNLDECEEHFDKYNIYHLAEYQKEYKVFLDSKRENDIILELECIYDKEYLRNFLLEHYNWSDTNYDAVYDYYMSKQPNRRLTWEK